MLNLFTLPVLTCSLINLHVLFSVKAEDANSAMQVDLNSLDIDLNSEPDDNTQPTAANNNHTDGNDSEDQQDDSFVPATASSSKNGDTADSFEAMTNVTSLPGSVRDPSEHGDDRESIERITRTTESGQASNDAHVDLGTQVALSSGRALRNTWKSGGRFLTEVNSICNRDFDGRFKFFSEVADFAAVLRNSVGNVEIEPLQDLVNVKRVERLTTSSSVINKAKVCANRISRLAVNGSMVEFMHMVERINIAYYRYDYHINKKGKLKDFDEGVFQHLSTKTAQQLVSKICQGCRRYIQLVREFGVGLVLLPATFNPTKLESMSEDAFVQVLSTVDKDLFKARLEWVVKDLIIPKQATAVVDFARNNHHAFESRKDRRRLEDNSITEN
ncbi:hypothetical protein BDB00DRAFT_302745 [Zychaea mexicana]|uniref:uncharacterized protein n=1 Tax=Zychaea mexicana TaxID=64656 RepID=UPI0022FDE585|nr:uncharacterized protein BDB00DRAFT_302745 [Zychaea mexicana]KAI9467659.1 hypothetical protein BDB00DRAFT_302745 [Zychaea mexicana]